MKDEPAPIIPYNAALKLDQLLDQLLCINFADMVIDDDRQNDCGRQDDVAPMVRPMDIEDASAHQEDADASTDDCVMIGNSVPIPFLSTAF